MGRNRDTPRYVLTHPFLSPSSLHTVKDTLTIGTNSRPSANYHAMLLFGTNVLLLAKVNAKPEQIWPTVMTTCVQKMLVASYFVQIAIGDDQAFFVLAESTLGDL